MKRIQEYQMLLNASKIPYLEKKKSYLCESNCNSPENVAEIMEKCFQMSNLPEEHVYAIALNTRSSIIGVFEISRGTVAASLLSAREILIRMLIVGATHFLICHNHPSGHLQPSEEVMQLLDSLDKNSGVSKGDVRIIPPQADDLALTGNDF